MRTYSHWLDDTEEFTLCGRPMNHVPHPQIAVFKDEVTCNLCVEALDPPTRHPIAEAAREGRFAALTHQEAS